MADDLGVFVVQRETDGVWEADCINEHCGYGMHGVAELTSRGRAEKAATAHRAEVRAELQQIEELAVREHVNWQALAEDRERRLSNATRLLRALRRYVRHVKGCGHYWGRACDCGLDEVLSPGTPTSNEETPNRG